MSTWRRYPRRGRRRRGPGISGSESLSKSARAGHLDRPALFKAVEGYGGYEDSLGGGA